MWAAAEDHVEVVKLLIARGADVRATTEEGGFTALTFASRQGALESARVADRRRRRRRRAGRRPPARACCRWRSRTATTRSRSLLLEHGARANAADKGGRTALHALVTARAPVSRERAPGVEDSSDGLDLMRALLAAGANPDAMTAGVPKLTDALVPSAIRPIIDNAINTGGATPFLLAAQAVDVEAMRVLVAGGADPRATTYGGTTALMLAAGLVFVEGSQRFRPESEALEAVRLALELGDDVNAINEHGQTALHGAVYRAANTIIEELARAGARTDLADERGRTPLASAEQGFNQVASVIRRERAAELLRQLEAQRAGRRASRRDVRDDAPVPALFLLAFCVARRRRFAARAAPSSRTAPASPPPTPRRLHDYCQTCHNPKLDAAGLTLDALDLDRVGDQAETWEKVVRKLRTRAMPPPGQASPRRRRLRIAGVRARSRRSTAPRRRTRTRAGRCFIA